MACDCCWNDCAQLLVYLAGAIAAGAVIIVALPGGWEQIRDFAVENNKARMFDFTFTLAAARPYTFWGGLIGGMFLTTATHGADQMMVQRYLSARSQRDAALAIIASGAVVFLQFLLFVALGLALAAFYHPRTFPRNDEIFADFIVRHMPPVLTGLTLAAVFAAAMSTLSSSLNSSAAAAIKDLLLPLIRKPISDRATLWTGRLLTVLFGIVQMAVAVYGRRLNDSVIDNVLAIAGFTTGIVLGVFFLGLFTRNVRQTAAVGGLLSGLVAVSLAAFWFRIAWPWFTVVGVTSTFVSGFLVQAGIDSLRRAPTNP
jgi:solute:Na+ symporter, SSS family